MSKIQGSNSFIEFLNMLESMNEINSDKDGKRIVEKVISAKWRSVVKDNSEIKTFEDGNDE
jgi:hypothetical protein